MTKKAVESTRAYKARVGQPQRTRAPREGPTTVKRIRAKRSTIITWDEEKAQEIVKAHKARLHGPVSAIAPSTDALYDALTKDIAKALDDARCTALAECDDRPRDEH